MASVEQDRNAAGFGLTDPAGEFEFELDDAVDGLAGDDFEIDIGAVDDGRDDAAGDPKGDDSLPTDAQLNVTAEISYPSPGRPRSEIGYEDEEAENADTDENVEIDTSVFASGLTSQEDVGRPAEEDNEYDEIDYDEDDGNEYTGGASGDITSGAQGREVSSHDNQTPTHGLPGEAEQTTAVDMEELDASVSQVDEGTDSETLGNDFLDAAEPITNGPDEQDASYGDDDYNNGADLDSDADIVDQTHRSIVQVTYQGTTYPLFAASDSDDSDNFFLRDTSALDSSLSEFLVSIRDVIQQDLSSQDELFLKVDGLGLEFGETSPGDFLEQTTFGEILKVHDRLVRNEDDAATKELYISIEARKTCMQRLAELREGALAGRGLSSYAQYDDYSEDHSDFTPPEDDDHEFSTDNVPTTEGFKNGDAEEVEDLGGPELLNESSGIPEEMQGDTSYVEQSHDADYSTATGLAVAADAMLDLDEVAGEGTHDDARETIDSLVGLSSGDARNNSTSQNGGNADEVANHSDEQALHDELEFDADQNAAVENTDTSEAAKMSGQAEEPSDFPIGEEYEDIATPVEASGNGILETTLFQSNEDSLEQGEGPEYGEQEDSTGCEGADVGLAPADPETTGKYSHFPSATAYRFLWKRDIPGRNLDRSSTPASSVKSSHGVETELPRTVAGEHTMDAVLHTTPSHRSQASLGSNSQPSIGSDFSVEFDYNTGADSDQDVLAKHDETADYINQTSEEAFNAIPHQQNEPEIGEAGFPDGSQTSKTNPQSGDHVSSQNGTAGHDTSKHMNETAIMSGNEVLSFEVDQSGGLDEIDWEGGDEPDEMTTPSASAKRRRQDVDDLADRQEEQDVKRRRA